MASTQAAGSSVLVSFRRPRSRRTKVKGSQAILIHAFEGTGLCRFLIYRKVVAGLLAHLQDNGGKPQNLGEPAGADALHPRCTPRVNPHRQVLLQRACPCCRSPSASNFLSWTLSSALVLTTVWRHCPEGGVGYYVLRTAMVMRPSLRPSAPVRRLVHPEIETPPCVGAIGPDPRRGDRFGPFVHLADSLIPVTFRSGSKIASAREYAGLQDGCMARRKDAEAYPDNVS